MTHLGFDGKVAIVTGAGNGLGRHHALLLASRGARVVVNDLGGSVTGDGADTGPAEAVAREIRDQGGDAVADTHSVATREGGEAIVRTALKTYGQLDILVNNAGIVRDVAFGAMTPGDLDPMIDVHLKGAFHVTGPAWRVMREEGYGRVVNTASAADILGSTHKSHYGAAKTGGIGFTRVLAIEGAEHNIRVNAIAPIAATRMLTATMAGADGDTDRQLNPASMAMMHAVTSKLAPALVAPVVAFLAQEDCPVTGEIYTAGAGVVVRFFIGRTKGYYHPALSVEDVRDHLAEIRDEAGYTTPEGAGGEIAQLLQAIATGVKLL